MKSNLHITIDSVGFATRILKETNSLSDSGLLGHIYIVGLHEGNLVEYQQLDDGRSIRRFRLITRGWPRSFPIQVIKYLEFCGRVIRYGRSKDIGLVNIHSLPLLPLGAFLKILWGTKLVYDAHELETETYGLTGIKQWLARAIERLLIRTADLVIVVGDGIKHWYEKKYKLRNIVTVLNCPEFHRPERTELLHEKLGIPKNRRIVIYQGGLEPGRGIEQLLDVFSQLSDDHHVLVFMGFGTLEGLIKERGRESSNIYYQPAVEPASVLRYTASAHVGISYINNNSLNDYLCLPNKFFEYIMAGIPVIVNNVPEMRRVVTENSIGLVLPELTTRSLKEALKTIESWDVNMLKANLNRVAKLCAWENQSRAMIEAYKKHVFERA